MERVEQVLSQRHAFNIVFNNERKWKSVFYFIQIKMLPLLVVGDDGLMNGIEVPRNSNPHPKYAVDIESLN